jgi:small-conductance mechanosensitive channel
LSASTLHALLLLLEGLVLFGGLWALGYALELVPMSRGRREQIVRIRPVVGAIAGLFYALFVARRLFADYPTYLPLILTGIVAAFIIMAWFALRDVFAGVVLKAGRVCSVGDHVQINGVEGRVTDMGMRVLTLETTEGDEAIIPYSRLARDSLLRTPVQDTVSVHVFEAHLPDGMSSIEGRTCIREAALRSHWSPLTREPKVARVGEHTFEVTVFSLDAEHGPYVERAVRQALARRKNPPSTPEFRLP